MKMLALILSATALIACSDDDDVVTQPPPGDQGGDDQPPPENVLRWSATITALSGYGGLTGSAFVTQTIGDQIFTADVTLRGDFGFVDRPWHVHEGGCPGGAIVGDPGAYPLLLTDATGTASTSVRIATTLDPAQRYSINLHLGPTQLATLIACGELFLE